MSDEMIIGPNPCQYCGLEYGAHQPGCIELAAPIGSELPLSLTVKVEATNGSTTRYALEAVLEVLKKYRYPKTGQVIEDKYWRATILEAQDQLPNTEAYEY